MDALFTWLQIEPQHLVAGFAGGLVAALVTAGSKPSTAGVASSVVIGGCCGAYLGPLAPGWLPVWMGLRVGPGTSFGVGLASTPICRGIILVAQRVKWDRKP